ncbi:Met-10+ like-protein-domain-containing protein [Amylocystis lapponica]|nr:Met-10+ like-protein-domain-containing protein [Amylocystis lapponica]
MLVRLRSRHSLLVSCSRTPIMSRRSHTLDVSPPIHRGMSQLDTTAFHKSVPVLAAKVPPAKAGVLLQSQLLKRSLIDAPKVRSVVNTQDGKRLVLFRFSDKAALPPEALDFLNGESAELLTHTLDLNYDYWTADDILHSILPEELVEGAPSGFAATGHIAHLNLNTEYLPYKHVIGKVILDKNKHIRTVVNKLDSISNQFRVFDMELLAGEPDYVVEHSESNCRFTFDFTEVYWNSRLHTEHARLVEQFRPEDVVADVFAGVGPFAIPAAKKGCGIFANDLNPNSYKFLTKNVADNKVTTLVRPSCEDGRAFIRGVFSAAFDNPVPPASPPKPPKSQRKLERHVGLAASPARLSSESPAPRRKRITHFAMNLPDSAIEFLDAFRGVLSPTNISDRDLSGIYATGLPMVHCYCFTRELEPEKAEADIRQRVEEKLGHALEQEDMYCISFRLPRAVALSHIEPYLPRFPTLRGKS